MSSRNDDFTNRRHISTVYVRENVPHDQAFWNLVYTFMFAAVVYASLATWAVTHPTGRWYTRSKWKRKRLLLMFCPTRLVEEKDEERRMWQEAEARRIIAAMRAEGIGPGRPRDDASVASD